MSAYADFFCLAQRFRWAAAIFSRAAAERTRFLLVVPYSVEQRVNPYPDGEDADYGTWEKALDVGRSYLVGATVPMSEFQRVHTSSLNEWQRLAYEWCMANPSRMLVLTSTKPRLIYHIAKRGEYVEFGLPHHCHGGEKYWVSRNGKTRVLINVD